MEVDLLDVDLAVDYEMEFDDVNVTAEELLINVWNWLFNLSTDTIRNVVITLMAWNYYISYWRLQCVPKSATFAVVAYLR